MTQAVAKAFSAFILFFALLQVAGCGSGGSDLPFIFDGGDGGSNSGSDTPPTPTPPASCSTNTDCSGGKTCNTTTHVCETPATSGCTDNTGCIAPQVCNITTHTCQDPVSGGCTATSDCPSGQVCDTATHQCGLTGACEVDLNATLALKIDDNFSAGHFDSPPKCCEYADLDGGPTCPSLAAGNLDNFLLPPSENSDLYCCSADTGNAVSGHADLFCDSENRHGGAPELAVTRWAANGAAKLRLKFAVGGGGSTCTASLVRDKFPQFRLENTALDASLIIDAGKDYQNFPPNPTVKLNADEITAPCTVSTDGSGNVQVAIDSLPLRFMAQLYENYKQCTEVNDLGSSCSSGPFTRRYLGDAAASFQVLPGFNNPALTLTTGSTHVDPTNAANQPGGTMTLQGSALHFDTADSKSKMSLVAAFAMPDSSLGTSRDDATGSGQLLAELGGAILTAEIMGTVTKTNGQPIQTLADLTTNCGSGGGPGGDGRLEITMRTTVDSTDDNLVVTGDPAKPTEPFTAEACVPGDHEGGSCHFFDLAALPFAKDTAAGDPIVGTEAKFVKEGTLFVQNASASTASMVIQVAEKAGAFRILNSSSLQNVTLSPGNSTTLNIRFEPETNASGCTTTAGVVDCQASLSLSSDHSVTVTLKGRAKAPAAEIHLDEIGPAEPNASVATVLPAAAPSPIDFGETLLGIQTKTKLYQLSNTGVRNLVINDVQAQDVKRNFRMGSIYQGSDFQHREWKIGQSPWTVAPSGTSSMFFFLNYGPFGKVGGSGDTRSDAGTLVINANSGVQSINLIGSAKKDSRATIALYVEDSNRFTVTGAGDADLKDVTDGPDTRHLYLPKSELASFRQDDTTRVVYLMNNGTAAGVDDLVIQGIKFNPDAGAKFVFTAEASPEVTACLAAAADATAACATLTAAGDTNKIKLGTVKFNATSGGSYSVSDATLVVKAISKAAAATDGVPPIIAGHIDNTNSSPTVTFQLKGANGAPSGMFDLKVHRLIAGFSNKINQGLQKTLIVSGSTKGILKRFNDQPGPDVNLDQLKEVFTMQDGISLNPVTGQATLKRFVTHVDADMNNPASASSPGFEGLRLYNAPGSNPSSTEYFAECLTAGAHNCAFFYLYVGEWAGSILPASCNGATKTPVMTNYSGSQTERDALFATVMKPDVAAEYACLSGPNGMKDKTNGLFDPVTGDVSFNDLAVRLYAPNVPALSNNDVDATIRLSLTTRCISQSEVPDPAARAQYLVPSNALNDSSYNTTLLPANPLTAYTDLTGSSCATRELHGRPMFSTDTTNTLDNDTDSDTLNFGGFDLAGVGRNVTSQTSVAPANMYIVIKAEVGSF